MYNYLQSFIWNEEVKDIEVDVDEKQKRRKYLLTEQIKSSKIRLKPVKKILPHTPIWSRLKKSHLKITPIL
jgi:hypothetical protein